MRVVQYTEICSRNTEIKIEIDPYIDNWMRTMEIICVIVIVRSSITDAMNYNSEGLSNINDNNKIFREQKKLLQKLKWKKIISFCSFCNETENKKLFNHSGCEGSTPYFVMDIILMTNERNCMHMREACLFNAENEITEQKGLVICLYLFLHKRTTNC